MKKLLEQYITKTVGQTMIDDLQFLLGDNFNIFNMLNIKTIQHKDSEVHFRKNHIVTNIRSKFNKNILPMPAHQLRTGKAESRLLFINGVVTPYALALHQADMLAKYTGQDVELLHNETDGLIRDLIECNEGRYGIINKVAQDTIECIQDKLKYEGELHIVAHSQGAIIITSALLELSKTLSSKELSRINFYSFGAGFKESVLPLEIKSEHFANTLDPITHLGLQNKEHPFTGELYLRHAHGHFFIVDYLFPFLNKEFSEESRFANLIDFSLWENQHEQS